MEKLKWKLILDLSLGTSALILELPPAAVLITFNLVILGLRNFMAAYGIAPSGTGCHGCLWQAGPGSQLHQPGHGIKSSRLTRKSGICPKTALIMVLIYLTVLFYSNR